MKRPATNNWIIIPLIIVLSMNLFLAAWCIRDAFFTPQEILDKHPDKSDPYYIFNMGFLIYTSVISLMSAIAISMIILRKRTSWVWNFVLIVFALFVVELFTQGMKSLPFFLLVGVSMYFWFSPKNRHWYKPLYTRKK